MTGRQLTPAEKIAWKAVTRSVRRRPDADRLMTGMDSNAETDTPSNPTKTRKSRTPSADASTTRPAPAQAGALDQARAPGPSGQRVPVAAVADRGRDRKVRRGQVVFSARLDLHGHTQSSAEAMLRRFVQHQSDAGARCVLVITGKGRDGQSVLKRNFLHWIDSPDGRAVVSGIAEAHPRHGGGGAFYVWLRRRD